MRADEFITDEEKLDEILPLIGAALGGAARVAGGLAARAAAGVGRAAVRGATSLAKGAATSLAKGVASTVMGGDDDEDAEQPTDPNAKVGTTPSAVTAKLPTATTGVTKTMATKADTALANLKPGTNIQMPTNTGKVGNFKVTRITPNDVEIENPDKLKNPTEPDKIIYNKNDLAKVMGTK